MSKKDVYLKMLEQIMEDDMLDDSEEDVEECGMTEEYDESCEEELEESPIKPEDTQYASLLARKVEQAIRANAEAGQLESPELKRALEVINKNKNKITPATGEKIKNLIAQYSSVAKDGGIEDVEAKIQKNREKQAAEIAAQKAANIEKMLGGKMFADSKNFDGLNNLREGYVKQLRALLENQVEQASVLMAAKGFSQDIQTMIEKLGRLMNEELGPVIDNMRMAYGQAQAESFGQAMRTDMQSIMDTLLNVKENIDDAVDELAAGQVPSMENDMDDNAGIEGGDLDSEFPMDGDDSGLEQTVDDIADDFGGDDAMSGPEEEPLGRPQKESVLNLKKQILEAKIKLAKAKAKRK